jgi:FtsP/CotA-like multicopper oxidase with cupredoxin domain
MNTIPKLLTLAGAVLAVGCVEQKVQVDPVPINLASCRPNTHPDAGKPSCEPIPTGVVNANFRSNNVAPPNICVDPGQTVRIMLSPKPTSYNSVVVLPKDANSFTDWLIRFNDREIDAVLIKIPEDAPAGKTFEYRIVNLADGRCIDPRIHIN